MIGANDVCHAAPITALAMSQSSVSVITNALRLRALNLELGR